MAPRKSSTALPSQTIQIRSFESAQPNVRIRRHCQWKTGGIFDLPENLRGALSRRRFARRAASAWSGAICITSRKLFDAFPVAASDIPVRKAMLIICAVCQSPAGCSRMDKTSKPCEPKHFLRRISIPPQEMIRRIVQNVRPSQPPFTIRHAQSDHSARLHAGFHFSAGIPPALPGAPVLQKM